MLSGRHYALAVYLFAASSGASAPAKPAPKRAAAPPRVFSAARVIKLNGLQRVDAAELLDATRLAILYEMGYAEASSKTGGWRLANDTRLTTRLFFEKKAGGARRTLEVGAQMLSELGARIVLAGSGPGRNAKEALADFERVAAKINENAKALQERQARLGLRRFALETIQLKYVDVDRTLAMLKLLGYTVIEFKETEFRKSSDRKRVLAKMFAPVKANKLNLPVIARMIDAERTWIEQTGVKRRGGRLQLSVTPDIGGKEMPEVTEADPLQRIMVIYDPTRPDSLYQLKNILVEQIDVPARQIVIECMVIEVLESKLKELGLSFSRLEVRGGGAVSLSFEDETVNGETRRPLTFTYDDSVTGPRLREFKATLKALLRDGAADILSKPSVLALNNHQARIRVGREIPILNSVITSRTTNINIEYFPVGIVLNIKPRIGYEDREVSLQVEAIVSNEDPEDRLQATDPNNSSKTIDLAPYVNTRIVQTYARVTNGTPFIIGGLVARDKRESQDRVPYISRIPLIGKFFSSRSARHIRTEVIIVLTPHIVPQDITNFSYIVPKDSDDFDTMESRLFRSAYRLRTGDVFDLRFLYDSQMLRDMRDKVKFALKLDPSLEKNPSVAQFMEDRVPGEAVLVRRQLYEIIKRMKLAKKIDTKQIIFFKKNPAKPSGFEIGFLAQELKPLQSGWFTKRLGKSNDVLVIKYAIPQPGQTKSLYGKPIGSVEIRSLGDVRGEKDRVDKTKALLRELNTPTQYAIVLGREEDLDRLKAGLIIKELVKINSPHEALRLSNFQVGRNLLFPSFPPAESGERSRKFYLVDDAVARCFYQTEFYYTAFKEQFDRAFETASKTLDAVLNKPAETP